MTEEEYVIEMLCSLPKHLLLMRMNNNPKLPRWLLLIDIQYVIKALDCYDNVRYVNLRKEMYSEL